MEPPSEDRRFAAAKRARQPQPAFPIPLVFAAAKTTQPFAQDTKAAVRGAALRGFAKQTEKGAWKRGESLLSQTIPSPFSINCRDNHAANFQPKRRFFGTFLTQESTVSPPSPYTFFTPPTNTARTPQSASISTMSASLPASSEPFAASAPMERAAYREAQLTAS